MIRTLEQFCILHSAFCILHFAFQQRKRYASFVDVSIELSSRTVARKVFSPLQSLTSVFGMGTGGPSAFVTLTFLNELSSLNIEQHEILDLGQTNCRNTQILF